MNHREILHAFDAINPAKINVAVLADCCTCETKPQSAGDVRAAIQSNQIVGARMAIAVKNEAKRIAREAKAKTLAEARTNQTPEQPEPKPNPPNPETRS